jgi:hypothetical protein
MARAARLRDGDKRTCHLQGVLANPTFVQLEPEGFNACATKRDDQRARATPKVQNRWGERFRECQHFSRDVRNRWAESVDRIPTEHPRFGMQVTVRRLERRRHVK